jgi:peroxiredoxin
MAAPSREEKERPVFDFLLGTDGRRYSLSSFAGARVLVVVFAGNGCPSVAALEPWIVDFQNDYAQSDVTLVWINSNNAALSPADTYEEMVKRAVSSQLPFAYLKDDDGRVARSFGARTTPHAFVLDEDREIRYRGRVADSRQAASIREPYVRDAVEDLLAGRSVALPETEPYGCAIVW